jgi:anti-sigma-K factor RskA
VNEKDDEKLIDFLSQKAIYGLSSAEEREFLASFPEWKDDFSFDATVSAIDLANIDQSEQLPVHLQNRILDNSEQYFVREPQRIIQETSNARPNWLGWFGWVAAAACALLAFSLWTNSVQAPPTYVNVPNEATSPTQLRQKLLDLDKNVVQIKWAKGNIKELPEVDGDIVWSDEKQSGYMTFRGLPVNDPTKECYQLWIFDETQDEKTPIDGGIFDVKSTGELIVPVIAKLKVKRPKLFAVTVEKPGGVVVSKREKIPALAKISI